MQINLLEPDLMKQGRTEYEHVQIPGKGIPGKEKGIDPFTRDLVPAKVGRIARVIYQNIETLLDGKSVFITRKEAQRGMECRRYVNDSQVLNMVKFKLSIAMRENVYGMKEDYFKGGVLKAGWEEDMVTIEDEDKVIYIKFDKPEDLEMSTISMNECVYIKC